MARATGFALGFAGVVLTGGTALAQRVRGIPLGGGDSGDGGAFAAIVFLLGLIVLAVVLVIGLAQMLFYGGMHAFLWSMVGLVSAYDWVSRFLPAPRIGERTVTREEKLEHDRLVAGRARVRKLLSRRLPQCTARQIESALDQLGFVDYLRLPMYVSVKQYNARLLGIKLPEGAEKAIGTIEVDLTYGGEMFMQRSVVVGG